MSLTLEVTHPAYLMMSSDFSQQEPKITACVSQDPSLISAFQNNRDVYATIASIALGVPFEDCLEFKLDENGNKTDEVNPEGKARRSIGKVLNLGITYGMSVQSIAESLFGDKEDMTEEEKMKQAQKIQDSLMKGFPHLAKAITGAQQKAIKVGYTETILGRRRHHPDMQLPRYEFEPDDGYVNPDIDPLDPESLKNKEQIPKRIVDALTKEFNSYKWYGKIVKRTKELKEQHIKVINNSYKIEEASRQVFNCVDKETEILTLSGWKRWNEVSVGDKILSYSIQNNSIEEDVVNDVHIYNQPTEVIDFESPTFSSSSTPDHRWVVQDSKGPVLIKNTQNIYKNKWPDYPILRVGDNNFSDYAVSDDELKLLGWMMTDASVGGDVATLYQSIHKTKNKVVYEDMIDTLNRLNLVYRDSTYYGQTDYHSMCIKVCDKMRQLCNIVNQDKRVASFEFISKLSQRQCKLLLSAMLQGDGSGVDGHGAPIGRERISITCNTSDKADLVQYIAFRAGYATNAYEITPEQHNNNPSSNKVYSSVPNGYPIKINKSYYDVCILRIQRAQIYPHHKSIRTAEDGVWCVSTNNQTWIARRHGKTYITGNSIIQGSAADVTKMAMLNLENDDEWKEIGGRFLLPIHDELVCEVPIDNIEKGSEVLARCMASAGDFLPFKLTCDVERTFRWYGLPYDEVISREKPTSLDWDNLSTSNIEWLQCMVVENEFILPTFPEEDGSKPSGIRAKGVNGKITDELKEAIESYKNRYNLQDDESFLDHIEAKVFRGVY